MLRKKLMVVLLLAAMLAMVLGGTVPAVAQNSSAPVRTIVFVPAQTAGDLRVPDPGGTLSCSGTPYSAPSGTCTPLGSGMIAEGQVCDTPTTVTVFGSIQLSAFECHAPNTTSAPDITLVGPRVVLT